MSKLYLPKVIAHRGASAYAPENTLSAIHAAADMGIEWVEMDVKLSRDGVPVVFHDEDLERCTGAQGLVMETDFQALRELDAGSWYGESFIGEKIPALEEALDAAQERGLGVILDIRPCPGREIDTAEAALDMASRIWDEDKQGPLVVSRSHVSLESARDMIESWPRALPITEETENWEELIEYLAIHVIAFDGNRIDRDQMEEYMETQKPLLTWTINNPEKARELVRWGVDAFISDAPDIIREAVETKH